MWLIRFVLIGGLGIEVCVIWHLLRHRRRYEGFLENRIFNVTIVIVYLSFSYLIAVLPPAGGWRSRPAWLLPAVVHVGFPIIGVTLIAISIILFSIALKQRKVIGSQEVKEGLITSGVYRWFRHPIYTGIMWSCLGGALLTRNPDGLLSFPALLGINFAQAISEEKNDMGARFRKEYHAYKQTVRMFGPIWLWGSLILILLVLLTIGNWN